MPTPSLGALRLQADIAAVSLGSSYAGALTTNVGMNNFTLGGTYIPNIVAGNNASVQTTTSNMSFSNYWSVWGYKRFSFTLTAGVGTYTPKLTPYTYYGFSLAFGSSSQTLNPYNTGKGTAFGSISANQFLTPSGTMTVQGFFRDTGGTATNGCLVLWSSTLPPNTDLTWISAFNGAGSISFARTATATSVTSGTSRFFAPSAVGTFGTWTAMTNGSNYSCYINYYG